MSVQRAAEKIIDAVTSPLGFFVLALLIVVAFLATVLLAAGFQETMKATGMFTGVGMFLIVILIVTVLVWCKPDHLTFDKEAHLRDRNKPPFGTESHIAPSSEVKNREENNVSSDVQ